ncbi:uncharacterized protein LOC135465470 [Liolophura sinensis]|uniref:uncharacterized protein LOC135465470 n=1 Tax=Liolophura sinensis TaxID=3198878 RepID=UPI0031587596
MKKSKAAVKSKGKKIEAIVDLQQNESVAVSEIPVLETEELSLKMPQSKKISKTKFPVRSLPANIATSSSASRMPSNMLQQFEAANATVVELQDSLQDLDTGRNSLPKVKALSEPQKRMLSRPTDKVTRDVLFDDFKSPGVYPIHKLLDAILKRDKLKDQILYFTGVEQLTDGVFGRLLEEIETNKKVVADLHVIGVDLTGCKQLTDQAVLWMAKCFPSITKVKLSGCWNLTSRSVVYLHEHCQHLREVEAITTGISLVPRTLSSVTLTLDGSPILSPSLSDLEALKAGKELDLKPVQTVRVCIFPVEKAPANFLSYMSSGAASNPSQAHFFGHSEVKLADGSVCQVTESPQVACCWPEFLSERTIYILPYDAGQGDANQIATAIVKLISVISSQVTQPFFIPVGTLSPTVLTSAIKQCLKLCEDNLKKELDVFNNKVKVEEMTYQTQCSLGKARQLLYRLQTTASRLNTLEINTSNPKDKDTLLSLLMRLRDEDLKKAYPEYSDISADLMTAVTSLPKLLPKGVATKEAAMKSIKAGKLPKSIAASDWHIEKALNLAHALGLVVQVPSVTASSYVAKPDWLMGFLNSLFSNQGVKSEMENGLPAGIPCLAVDSVQDAVGLNVAKELGVAAVRGAQVGLVLSQPDQPTVSKFS